MIQSQYLPSNRTPLAISQRADSQRGDEPRINENAVSYLPSPITQKALLQSVEENKKSHSPFGSYNYLNLPSTNMNSNNNVFIFPLKSSTQ